MSNETTNNNIFKQDITTINHDASSSEQNASMANLRKQMSHKRDIDLKSGGISSGRNDEDLLSKKYIEERKDFISLENVYD